MKRILPWVGILVSALILVSVLTHYPISIWDVGDYAESPVSISYLASQGQNVPCRRLLFLRPSPLCWHLPV